MRVMVALPVPEVPVAVTVSVPDAGIWLGAVYRPVELTVPVTAAQEVALLAVNCWLDPRTTCAAEGVTTGAGAGAPPPDPPPEVLAFTGMTRALLQAVPGFRTR